VQFSAQAHVKSTLVLDSGAVVKVGASLPSEGQVLAFSTAGAPSFATPVQLAAFNTAVANVSTLYSKIQDLQNHYKGDVIGFSPGERAVINFFQSMYGGDATTDTAVGATMAMYSLLTRSGYQLKQGHLEYDTPNNQSQNNQANNMHLPQSNTFEQDHPSSRSGFQNFVTGTWDHDDDDDPTDGMCVLDNDGNIPNNGSTGFFCRFVFDTWRKRRGTGDDYIQDGRDSLWFLQVFKCEGAARWCIRTDGGCANFSTKDIDQDWTASDNQQTAQGRSWKIPFVSSSRYITGTIIKENETSSRGRLKFGICHTTYHTKQTTVANTGGVGTYVYDLIDASKQFSLAT
jgi:hypothetical protein